MKKLLSILSTITIAGSGISGIVGNAPASIKVKENNNLKNLKRIKRDTSQSSINNWKTDIDNWKNNIQNEKNEIIRRLDRDPGFSPQEQQIQKQNKLIEFQNKKIQELENKVNQINESLKPSKIKILLKGCQVGGYAFGAVTGVASLIPNPITPLVSAISNAIAVVCTIVDLGT